jgi:hypothetical protein
MSKKTIKVFLKLLMFNFLSEKNQIMNQHAHIFHFVTLYALHK